MSLKPLSQLKRGDVKIEDLASKLRADDSATSKEAGLKLAQAAASFGLSVREYLILSVEPETKDGVTLNGYERSLLALNLPVRNDYEHGVHLQAASDTFATYPGTRALFPQVIDDILRFSTRQDQFEKVAPMLASSRVINGAEMLSTVVDTPDGALDSHSIAEGSRIPVRTIKTSEKVVKIFKHGSAIRTTYEFSRRASLDLLIPYANRIARELELSKVKEATAVLVNGDGAYGAAPEVNQSSFNTATGVTATNNTISWVHILAWLVSRAKTGTPIDTAVMNWDGYLQWMMLFAKQVEVANGVSVRPADNMVAAGVQASLAPRGINLALNITPVISSTAPANKIVGYSVGDTLEELVEAGSQIQETERSIQNQTMMMVRTENTGYRLVFGDTRSVFNFGA